MLLQVLESELDEVAVTSVGSDLVIIELAASRSDSVAD